MSLIAAAALAQSDTPSAPQARAEAVARATIVNPATLRVDAKARATLTQSSTAALKIQQRITDRPCPTPEAKACKIMVFDLP
jgi:hypothetical protein